MQILGEVRCLTCGRYLADAAEVAPRSVKLMAPAGSARPHVRLQAGRPFCTHCGGRAFVEYDLGHRGVLADTARAAEASRPLDAVA